MSKIEGFETLADNSIGHLTFSKNKERDFVSFEIAQAILAVNEGMWSLIAMDQLKDSTETRDKIDGFLHDFVQLVKNKVAIIAGFLDGMVIRIRELALAKNFRKEIIDTVYNIEEKVVGFHSKMETHSEELLTEIIQVRNTVRSLLNKVAVLNIGELYIKLQVLQVELTFYLRFYFAEKIGQTMTSEQV